MHLKELSTHISQINFAVYICQRKSWLEVKAGKIQEKIKLSLWRRTSHGSRTSETAPIFFPLPSIYIFPLIPSSLFSQIRDIFPTSHLIGLSPVSLASYAPLVFLELELLHPNLCCIFAQFQYTPCLLLWLSFFPSKSLLPIKSLSLSSASKTACLSSIRLLALRRNRESHSRFHCAGAGQPEDLGARSQGQGGKER